MRAIVTSSSNRQAIVLHFGTAHVYTTCQFSVIDDVMSFCALRLSPAYRKIPQEAVKQPPAPVQPASHAQG